MVPALARANVSAPSFQSHGYAIAPDLISPTQCAFVRRAMIAAEAAGRMRPATDRSVKGWHNQYAPFEGQALLARLAPRIAQRVERPLLPAYSFWRIYDHGATLARHVDRRASEIAVTIALGAEPVDASPWPIWVQGLDGAERAIALAPGAAVIYQGGRVPHWREAFPGARHFQLFLFYVAADGASADLANEPQRLAAALDH